MRIAALFCLVVTGCLGPGLTVDVTGEGKGRIVSDPSGIDCGDSCGMIAAGPVTLVAQPDASSVFTGWHGVACSGAEPCFIDATEDTHVEAMFDSKFYPLVITRIGEGTVTAPGIECGDDCDQVVRHGTALDVVAKAAAGWALISLEGARCINDRCNFDMVEATSLSATFAPTNELIVDIESQNGGNGVVKSMPAAIDCGPSGSTACAADFSPAATVRLSAYPEGSSTFAGWTGACTQTTGDCVVTMDQARQVTARFSIPVPVQRATLAIMIDGASLGIVRTMYQNEIMCPGDCAEEYDEGSTVTLYAFAVSGATFAGWTGAGSACGSSTTCTVSISISNSFMNVVTARFQ